MSAKDHVQEGEWPDRAGQHVEEDEQKKGVCKDCAKESRHQHQYGHLCAGCMKEQLLSFQKQCHDCAAKAGECVCRGIIRRG